MTERDEAARRVFAPTMWAALERFERKRDPIQHYGYDVLPEDPGTVHALPGGRPFLGRVRPEFMRGEGPRALCGDRVLVRLPVSFDGEDPDACAECCELLARGVTRAPGGSGRSFNCGAVVRPEGAAAAAYGCVLRERHRGSHRAAGGETWETGPEDFTPAPDGYV